MSPLEQFSRRIEERTAEIESQREWTKDQSDEYMAAIVERQSEFQAEGAKLLTGMAQPRVEALAAHFPNSGPVKIEHGQACVCWFGYCDRFPASTELRLTIAHDDRLENVEISYEVRILPVFLKYDRFDKLTLPLTNLDDQRVTEWVENKLLGFLDTYLAIETADNLQSTALATDPVCGMRLAKDGTTLRHNYRGHPYYFCSKQCCDAFTADPGAYVWFKML
jgi:YHS domain-containing protein